MLQQGSDVSSRLGPASLTHNRCSIAMRGQQVLNPWPTPVSVLVVRQHV